MTLICFALFLIALGVLFVGGLCLAAKRGDEIMEKGLGKDDQGFSTRPKL